MKKILSLVLAFVLAFSMVALVACNNDTTNENNNTNNENNENNTAEKSYTLSIAVDEGFGSVSKSKVTNIALAIVFDEAGKIVAARRRDSMLQMMFSREPKRISTKRWGASTPVRNSSCASCRWR